MHDRETFKITTTDETPTDRREFVRRGLTIGLGSAVLPALVRLQKEESASPVHASEESDARAAGPIDGVEPFAVEEATVAQIQEAFAKGTLTSRALVDLYLARIEAMDRSGPGVNSVIELNPEARSIADFLDAERKAKGGRSPLHGIPVLIKDNIDTADKMRTSAGSLALANSHAPLDAGIVRRLRDAGAIILGKTNLSEWANWRSTNSTSGWSGRGGQTRNPYALDRNPCGSSSGTGAAIAASFATVGIGTETDGSIVCPSNANGLVGIKPTVGLVSRGGIIPISHSQDTAGPMSRTVRDAALLLGVIAGADARDRATKDAVGHVENDYVKYCTAGGLRGARIGVVRALFNAGPAVNHVMDDALKVLKRAGATLVDPVEIPSLGKLGNMEFEVLLYESKADINAYLASLGPNAPHKTLADLIRFNDANRATSMPYFGQEIFLQAEKKGPLTSPEYKKALAACRRLTRDEGIDLAMKKHKLDALLAPTGGPAWVTDLVNGDHVAGGSSTLAAVAGYPSITVPAGAIFGLPVGVSFIGSAWSEGKLIRLAYGFEQETHARFAPKFLPTADLTTKR